jgi:hypothetical protein
MPYVFSTAASDTDYCFYSKNGDLNVLEKKIRIKGGANIAQAGIKEILTPKGVCTEVTDGELSLLREHTQFKQHLDNGFLTISESMVKIEKAIKNLKPKDGSAPIVEENLLKNKLPTILEK